MKKVYVIVSMIAVLALTMLYCKTMHSHNHDIRVGLKNFYTYDYFKAYYKNFEEKDEIVTVENYTAFLEYAESFYRDILNASELKALAKLYNSEGAIVFRDSFFGLDGKNPLWEFGKTIVPSAPTTSDERLFQSVHETNGNMNDEYGRWACPLHPHFSAGEQGKCGICGMDLSSSEP